MKSLKEMFPLLDHCTASSLRALTRRDMFKVGLVGGAAAASATALGPFASVASAEPTPQACTSLVPAAAAGLMPSDQNVISLRWLGCACFELVFRNQVILLDAWFDRPLCRDIGLTPQQVVRANAIFIGHAHFDHIADASPKGKVRAKKSPTPTWLCSTLLPPPPTLRPQRRWLLGAL